MLHCCMNCRAIWLRPGCPALTEAQKTLLSQAMYCVKDRAKTFPELIEKAHFALASRPIVADEAAAKNLGYGIPWYTEIVDAATAKC